MHTCSDSLSYRPSIFAIHVLFRKRRSTICPTCRINTGPSHVSYFSGSRSLFMQRPITKINPQEATLPWVALAAPRAVRGEWVPPALRRSAIAAHLRGYVAWFLLSNLQQVYLRTSAPGHRTERARARATTGSAKTSSPLEEERCKG